MSKQILPWAVLAVICFCVRKRPPPPSRSFDPIHGRQKDVKPSRQTPSSSQGKVCDALRSRPGGLPSARSRPRSRQQSSGAETATPQDGSDTQRRAGGGQTETRSSSTSGSRRTLSQLNSDPLALRTVWGKADPADPEAWAAFELAERAYQDARSAVVDDAAFDLFENRLDLAVKRLGAAERLAGLQEQVDLAFQEMDEAMPLGRKSLTRP